MAGLGTSHPTLGGGSAVPVATAPFVQPPSRFAPVCPYIYRAAMQGLFLTPAARTNPVSGKKDVNGMNSTASKGFGSHAAELSNGIESGNAFAQQIQDLDSRASAEAETAPDGGPDGAPQPRSSTNALTNTAADASSSGPFLRSLRLKTILLLSPEHTPTKLKLFCEDERIQLVHCGLMGIVDESIARKAQDISSTSKSSLLTSPVVRTMITERNVKEGLELLLDTRKHPVLVLDTFGIHETGVLLGCLRKMMRWNFASIIVEYRAFAGSRTRASNERFIEMFDTELVTLPPEQWLPEWLIEDDQAMEENMDVLLQSSKSQSAKT